MMPVLRILDANANRAREALRVMEEAARFHLNDPELTESLKKLRHGLTQSLRRFSQLEFQRDAAGDVGREIETEAERVRGSVADVAIAAGKRLSESLRALEEYGKMIDEPFARAVERLRFRAYEVEQEMHRALGAGVRTQWRLCAIISEALCAHRPWLEIARAALDAGADCIQLREKSLSDRELLSRAEALRDLTAGRAAFIVNDRPDIALLAGADGVHLGQDDLPVARVRELAGRRLIIGVSTANLDQAKRAHAAGADYCGVGPMFPTTTKKKDAIAGVAYLREYVSWARLPHLAIGGISPDNIDQLIEAGCRGVAISSGICGAQEPDQVVRALLRAFESVPSV